ncbi:MAG: aldo/keto reductase [Ignavibacteria bacterium]|nr:aldo/keto reductase [Ignavibacteria bacterium]
MRYRLLGNSGLRVSELALGTMTFGEEWGWGANKEDSRRMFDMYMDAGGNFIDTANRYTEGTSETMLGEFMAADRGRCVLATKYTLFTSKDHPNASGNSRKNMVRSLEDSLRRLKTDYVDLYWVHAWDFLTPVEEVMRALDDLVRAGKVLYIGISDTPAWIVSRANMLAELRGWSRFAGLQIRYSLIDREPERELLPMARALGLAVTPWGALGSGILSGKYNLHADENGRVKGSKRVSEKNLAVAAAVMAVADELGCTPSQAALSWVRQQPGTILPLIGARTPAQLADNLGCLDVMLGDEQLRRLDEASAIELGFPHDFLNSPGIRELVYGGFLDRIDTH